MKPPKKKAPKKKPPSVEREAAQRKAKILELDRRLASAIEVEKLLSPISYGRVVQMEPHITARRVVAGIAFITTISNPQGQIVSLKHETRTDLGRMTEDLAEVISALTSELMTIRDD